MAVAMTRVLLTGISGVGKSSLVTELSSRGHRAVDLDSDAWSEWVAVAPAGEPPEWGTPVEPHRDWVWREDRVRDLLAKEGEGPLFVSGCAANQRLFRTSFDCIILLTAPRDLIIRRLAIRTTNSYGKRSDEVARVLLLMDTVEVGLRRTADHVVDTSRPLAEVAAHVLGLVQSIGRD